MSQGINRFIIDAIIDKNSRVQMHMYFMSVPCVYAPVYFKFEHVTAVAKKSAACIAKFICDHSPRIYNICTFSIS